MKMIAVMLALGLLLPMVGAQDAEAHFKKLSAELKAEQDVQRDGFRRVAATADYKATLKKLRANEGDRDELISKLNAIAFVQRLELVAALDRGVMHEHVL